MFRYFVLNRLPFVHCFPCSSSFRDWGSIPWGVLHSESISRYFDLNITPFPTVSFKVAQNSFQHFPRRRFWWFIITTLYQLMLQSWCQKTAQSLNFKKMCMVCMVLSPNRSFPSSIVPLFQNESKCETFHMKMSSACSFIFMQIKVIFITIVSHLNSLWNRGTRELGNGLLKILELRTLELQIWLT